MRETMCTYEGDTGEVQHIELARIRMPPLRPRHAGCPCSDMSRTLRFDSAASNSVLDDSRIRSDNATATATATGDNPQHTKAGTTDDGDPDPASVRNEIASERDKDR